MTSRSQPVNLWWLHPLTTVLLALVPFVIAAHLMDGQDYKEQWMTQKYLDRKTAVLLFAVVAAFAAGCIGRTLTNRRTAPVNVQIDYYRLQWMFLLSFLFTALGYIFWAGVCYTHGVGFSQVFALLRGDSSASTVIKELGTTIPGLTTATQLGMATAIFGAMLINLGAKWYVYFLLAVLLLMAMLRSMLWSERLATIEIVIPFAVALFGKLDPQVWRRHPLIRRAMPYAPVIACTGLYLYFTLSESLRSWAHYSNNGESIWYFSWMRLCGYYVTALNNGALMHETVGTLPCPYTALEFFWKFPGINLVFPYYDLFSVDPDAYKDTLKSMANPEFNNPSGVFPYICDFGAIGGCIFFFVFGWIGTSIFISFRRGTLPGLLFFPLLYISFLEISRVSYLTSARTLPSWFALGVALFVLKPHKIKGGRPRIRRLDQARALANQPPRSAVPA
jgi:hypothetical protein